MFSTIRPDRLTRDQRRITRIIALGCAGIIIYITMVITGAGRVTPQFQAKTIAAAAISPAGVAAQITSDPGAMPLLFPNLPQVITPTCGIVTALTGPSGSTAGSISIESRAYEIPPGTSIDPQIAICTNTCVTLDPFNQVLSVTYNAPSNISGAVTAYNPGTTIAINGTIYPLATGASVDPGVQTGAQVTVAINSAGAASCIRLNSSGEGGIKSRINLPYVTRNR